MLGLVRRNPRAYRIARGIKQGVRNLRSFVTGNQQVKAFHQFRPEDLSDDEVKAFMRHDAHRIEKSFYNNIFDTKREFYEERRKNVRDTVDRLRRNAEHADDPSVAWADEIAEKFETLPETFIKPKSRVAEPVDVAAARRFIEAASRRRPSRVWSAVQPTQDELHAFALGMVDAGRWAPTSGNRQPVRFKIMVDPDEKILLKGLKEEHCYLAPCLIFVGTDRRFYGGLGRNEAAIYIDTGAAAMQMVMTASIANYGVCWNHFTRDLIASRASNKDVYRSFTAAMNIPDHIEPAAIIAFGVVDSYPPTPARMDLSRYLL